MKGFKDVNSEAALKTAVAVARKQSEMKDSSTQTSPADKVDVVYRVCQKFNCSANLSLLTDDKNNSDYCTTFISPT